MLTINEHNSCVVLTQSTTSSLSQSTVNCDSISTIAESDNQRSDVAGSQPSTINNGSSHNSCSASRLWSSAAGNRQPNMKSTIVTQSDRNTASNYYARNTQYTQQWYIRPERLEEGPPGTGKLLAVETKSQIWLRLPDSTDFWLCEEPPTRWRIRYLPSESTSQMIPLSVDFIHYILLYENSYTSIQTTLTDCCLYRNWMMFRGRGVQKQTMSEYHTQLSAVDMKA